MAEPLEPWVNAQSVADHLGVSKDWVYDKASRGDLPSYKVGGQRKFKLSEIDEWVRQQGRSSVSGPTPLRPR